MRSSPLEKNEAVHFLPDTLTGIFTTDEAVMKMGSTYLYGYSIDCIMVSFVFCINSYFSGQGNSLFPMIHSPSAYLCRGCSAR